MAKKRKKKQNKQNKSKKQSSSGRRSNSKRVDNPNWHWERIAGYHPAYCTCAACVSQRTTGRKARPRQDDTSGTLAGDLLLLQALGEMDAADNGDAADGEDANPANDAADGKSS